MKKILLLWVACIFTFSSHAQLYKANRIYSGDLSYQQNTSTDERDFNFRSRIGLKISEGWYLGIGGGFQSYRNVSPGKPGLKSYFVPSVNEPILIDQIYYGTEANNLISLGPYVQRFIAIGEKTYLNLLTYVDYHQGKGSFTPQSPHFRMWIAEPSLASSYVLPSPRDFRERRLVTGLQIGLSHFFTEKIALDLNAGLVEWQMIVIEDSLVEWTFFDPSITRTEKSFTGFPQRMGLRLGIIILL